MSESISIDIGGMTCDGCSGKVKKALESITGVISAEVSHESGVAVIEHKKVSKEVLISTYIPCPCKVWKSHDEFQVFHLR